MGLLHWYLQGIVSGLEYIHSQGVMHLDIKPENILCTVDGRPKLADFGLSRTIHPRGMYQSGHENSGNGPEGP